ncbi:N-acetylglutamate synthase [Mammaliicoccus lentus]|jgi:glutamate N-acetyltransferase/amino-acid N-acetyltransferase|uniref:bifunctional glutamate N-acetyltransferase/amino-acid acetyltransferase ArgJ n=1 Tax=Mammaliicoccus TaxID=2803850 RepID=UPI0007D9CB7E|nr:MULTISPECIES: bifunctional glutamate N-acetyltransferase/amino-acid acetyltransferase ArgJ [Mammaliicoccus]MBF0750341.1 bifunctional glutamate N-acetyltransferase/amino-acid acetyltransferase ArgJ [Mammaliicoccus lentus]MBF0842653.1 bifunctional glutamate N-acetyltransferase/amino-acid acetyltransferase ArgJ [Mammaliicoccus lentus]MBW0763435.1 bifunctional glutamate N-acetyltransferase/amino-acid acetyltransferase ArgJ [Mammaliicoccus lentus]MCD2478488.1 bifunctional glutamate N-acetyltransf
MIEETKQVIDSEITILQDGDVASPNGYTAGGIHVGLRRAKKDFGWLYSSNPAQCAAVYTQNAFKAAPLQVTQASLNVSKQLSAVVINSAIANACTGERGLRDAIQTKKWISEKLQLPEHEIAVASTGLIGEFLPMDKIKYGVEHIDIEGATCSKDFNESILTTDKETKHIAVQVTIDGEVITVGGSSKGSGMINPNMATMLGFMTTDANVQAEDLEDILKPTVDDTFNMITVDGDTSTNDMVLLLANGMVGKQQLTKEHPEWHKFVEAVRYVCEHLAKSIAQDGEGATKLIKVEVEGAISKEKNNAIAKTIVGSSLVKTAIHGGDPNFGRFVTAIGYADNTISPNNVDVWLCDHLIVKQGMPVPFDALDLKANMEQDTIVIKAKVGNGLFKSTAFGCDLSYEYVRINALYST